MKPFLFFLFLLTGVSVSANNIQISNISVSNNAANTGKVIQFDLSWENSWRTASTGNWDGAWVFFKFRDNDGTWYPLRFTGTNITMPPGATYDMGNNAGVTGVGMFIYRAANGFGNVSVTGIKAGVQSFPGTFEVRGYAIEMVYIPQGSFYAGDGASGGTYQSGGPGVPDPPYLVTANGINMSPGGGLLEDPLTGGYSGTHNNFPSGYSAFWVMKYEVSQGAYRDFLNTLTRQQQVSRFFDGDPGQVAGYPVDGANAPFYDNYLRIATPAGTITPAVVACRNNDTATYEWRPVVYTNWKNVAAYLDWAGLRPLSELEYEKACRGPLPAVPGEYAWGTAGINDWTTLINGNPEVYVSFLDKGEVGETASNGSAVNGNATWGSEAFTNPMTTYWINHIRGGAFATAISNRVSSGASYYGVMELSGNAEEALVTTANAAGRSYTGKHGDGVLTVEGNANENNWPGVNGANGTLAATGNYNGGPGVVSDGGVIYRGGHYLSNVPVLLCVSVRGNLGNGTNTSSALLFRAGLGIRGCRDAN